MSDTDTATVVWSKDEGRFLKMVLKMAAESDTDIGTAAKKYEEAMGTEFNFVGGTEEFYDDPPTPADLLKNFEGSRWTGTRTDYEALQTALTVAVTEMTQAGQPVYEEMDTIDGIHTKIRRAYEGVGGETVGPDERPY